MSILRRQEHQGRRPGHHRLRGHLPRRPVPGLRHARSWAGVTPGKGGQTWENPSGNRAGLRHRAEAVRGPARTRPSSSCRRPSRPTRSSRPSTPEFELVVVHHRGDPGHSTWSRSEGVLDEPDPTPDRSQLPGRHHTRARVQDRHHAGAHPQARATSASSARSRHAHLRGGRPAHTRSASARAPAVGIGGDPIHGTDPSSTSSRCSSRTTTTPTASS